MCVVAGFFALPVPLAPDFSVGGGGKMASIGSRGHSRHFDSTDALLRSLIYPRRLIDRRRGSYGRNQGGIKICNTGGKYCYRTTQTRAQSHLQRRIVIDLVHVFSLLLYSCLT